MRHILYLLLPLVALLTTDCSQRVPQLNIFTWSEYLDPKIISEFEQKFGCRVVLDYYEDPESMMAKLASGGSSLYDIVVPSNSNLPALIKRGLLASLRAQNIPNLNNIDSRFSDTPFDPGNQYGAPYQWGTTGLYIRKSPGTTLDLSWALVFDPAKAAGPFLLLDDPRSCIGAALRYRGRTLNTTNSAELKEAGAILASAKKRSLGFEGAVGGRNRVLSKGASMAIVYSGDALRGMEEDPETLYFIPREGSEIWLDSLSIPARAPHRDLAENFINFMLDGRVAARSAEYTRAATPNKAALEFISPELLKNPAIYPPPEVMQSLEYAADLADLNQLYDDLWTHIKAD